MKNKFCYRCKTLKPTSEFHKNKRNKDGIASYCKPCSIEIVGDWQRRNSERQRAYEHRWDGKHPGKTRERCRKWRNDNPERVAEHNRKWVEAHPELRAANEARRRARELDAFGVDYTTDNMIQARIEYYGGRCWICNKIATEVDHVKPLAKGGAHLPCNLRPICRHCNATKHAKWPFPDIKIRSPAIASSY